MKKTLLFVALFSFTSANAKEIDGAFGFKLGAYFNRAIPKFSSFYEIGTGHFRSKEYSYEKLDNNDADAELIEYLIIVNKNNSIANIVRITYEKNKALCLSRAQKIAESYSKVYDLEIDKITYSNGDIRYSLTGKDKYKGIFVDCSGVNNEYNIFTSIRDDGLIMEKIR